LFVHELDVKQYRAFCRQMLLQVYKIYTHTFFFVVHELDVAQYGA
jgi:hypothetical protein